MTIKFHLVDKYFMKSFSTTVRTNANSQVEILALYEIRERELLGQAIDVIPR